MIDKKVIEQKAEQLLSPSFGPPEQWQVYPELSPGEAADMAVQVGLWVAEQYELRKT